jgi:hypothetical protein
MPDRRNFFWEPAKSQLAGETTKFLFHATDFEGMPADMQVELLKKSNEKYQWTLNEKVGDAWKQVATLEYVRTAD